MRKDLAEFLEADGPLMDGAYCDNLAFRLECSVCGGELTSLGVLGRREHLRCRNCGMDSSREVHVGGSR